MENAGTLSSARHSTPYLVRQAALFHKKWLLGGSGGEKSGRGWWWQRRSAYKKAGVGAFPLLSPIPPPLELFQKEIQDGREALLNPGYFLSSIYNID